MCAVLSYLPDISPPPYFEEKGGKIAIWNGQSLHLWNENLYVPTL